MQIAAGQRECSSLKLARNWREKRARSRRTFHLGLFRWKLSSVEPYAASPALLKVPKVQVL